MFFLIAALIGGSLYQAQLKYDYCKKEGFKPEYCSVQKKLHKLERFKK